MKLERDDLMLIARAIVQHKKSNQALGKALLENHFPAARTWATMLEANNGNLDNLFRTILSINGTIAPPDANAQMQDTGEDLTQAGVLLAYIGEKR